MTCQVSIDFMSNEVNPIRADTSQTDDWRSWDAHATTGDGLADMTGFDMSTPMREIFGPSDLNSYSRFFWEGDPASLGDVRLSEMVSTAIPYSTPPSGSTARPSSDTIRITYLRAHGRTAFFPGKHRA